MTCLHNIVQQHAVEVFFCWITSETPTNQQQPQKHSCTYSGLLLEELNGCKQPCFATFG